MQSYASIGQREGGGGGARPLSGYRFPSGIIVLAVRWYRRYRPSHADMAELLADRGVAVDPSAVCAWAREFAALDDRAALAFRRTVGARWGVDETYVKVAGACVYRANDEQRQMIDVFVSAPQASADAAAFFRQAVGALAMIPMSATTERPVAAVEGMGCAKEARSSRRGRRLLCGRDERMIRNPDDSPVSV